MSNCLTRGILSIAFALAVVNLFAAAPPRQDADKVYEKTYSIKRSSAEHIKARLQALMPDDLYRFTRLFANQPEKNDLTVVGPLAAIEMADRLIPLMEEMKNGIAAGTFSPIDAFTRPPAKESSVLRGEVYRCTVRDVQAFEAELSRRFGGNPELSFLFSDYAENQTLTVSVLASEELQAEFGKTLQEMGVLLPDQQRRSILQDRLAELPQYRFQPGDFAIVSRSFRPQRKPMGEIDSTLCDILRRRYTRISPAVDGEQTTGLAVYEYVIQTAEQVRSLRVELNYDRREIILNGDKRLCEQMVQLIEMIDAPSLPKGMRRQVIRIGGRQAHQVRQFVDAFAMQPHPKSPSQPTNVVAASPIPRFDQLPPSRYDSTTPFSTNAPIQRVAYKPQQDLSGLGGGGFDQGIGGGGDFPGGVYGYDSGPGGPGGPGGQAFPYVPQSLFINYLPEMDIILVEGTNADARRLMEMIKDIEKLLEDSKSKMEIVLLKNTDCVTMNEMLYDMYYYLLFSRKAGKVNLFPLYNPNALMVVGWGTAFDDMLTLIETLDQPLAKPGSTWKVFQLKHASATAVQMLLTEIFPPPLPTPEPTPYYPSLLPQLQPPPIHKNGSAWMPRIRSVVDARTNSIIVHAGPNDLREIEKILSKIDLYEGGPEVKIVQYRLRHSMASDVSTKLTTILTPGTTDGTSLTYAIETLDEKDRQILQSGIVANFKVTPDIQQNMLIVTAPEYALPLIGKLIEMLDSPIPTASMRMIPLYNASADRVSQILTNLVPSSIAGGQGIGPQMPGSRVGGEFIPLRFATDLRTNTIIAVGSEEELDTIEAIVYSLDKDDAEKRIQKVYTLKNAKAGDVAKTLDAYIEQKTSIISQSPESTSTYAQLEEALIVVAEDKTNSLVIEAKPKFFEEIMKVIEEIDRQPDQVVIQVLIAEVTRSTGNEFGAEFGLQDSVLFNRSTFSNSISGGVPAGNANNSKDVTGLGPGFNFNDPSQSLGNNLNDLSRGSAATVAPQILSNFNMGRTGSETGFGGMVFSASSDSVNILIRALEEKRRLEVLSRPQIMAMDNQMAFILIGERVPYVAGVTASGYSTSANVSMEEVGLMLMVRPQISPDGKVVMDIGVEKSSVGSTADGIPIPDGIGGVVQSPKISAITTKTNITASSNETVMLGGLLSKETLNVNRRVPFLSDIPVLGRLFQYKYDTMQKKELLIILTPRVVKHGKGETYSADAERIKREEAAKINWSLREVMRMHGSPNNVRIWDPMASQPVSGDAPPLYPTLSVQLDDLQELPQPPVRNKPVPTFEMFDEK